MQTIIFPQINSKSRKKGYVTGEVFPMIQKIDKLMANAKTPVTDIKPYTNNSNIYIEDKFLIIWQ
jgi:hypothetical protein